MPEETISQDEQLFIQLITSFSTNAWISLGKLKNPITDKVERDLQQASYSIDMLDMIFKRMEVNLSDREKQFLTTTISDLKMNYLEEMAKSEKEKREKAPASPEATEEEKAPEDKDTEEKTVEKESGEESGNEE